jgi:hypothetical protein
MTVSAILQSASFLYRVEIPGAKKITRLSGYEIAARLSYLIWASMPDQALFDAAEVGALDQDQGVKEQAERMLDDPRAHRSVATFFENWLDLRKLQRNDPKDVNLLPSFSSDLIASMRSESDLFVDDVFFANGTLDTLFTANYTFLNQPLAAFYGVSGPTTATFEKVTLDGKTRLGLFMQANFLAGQAKVNDTAPVMRGLFVRDRLLCDPPAPPPANIPSLPPPTPGASPRERLDAHRSDPACAGCHTLMDPIGFGFEHFDAVGQYRDMQDGEPIDATGELIHTEDVDGPFDGALELVTKLSQSHEVETCAVKQWFRFGYGRGESELDGCTLLDLNTTFTQSGGNWKALVIALTQSDAFLFRTNEGAP